MDQYELFRGRRVLITGHTGFKGAWLTLWLAHLGAEVHGFALPPDDQEASLFHEARLEDLLASSSFADIREPASVLACMKSVQPEIVFHLAAQALVRRSYREPTATWATNVMGTVHVLEAVRSVGRVRVCQIVTSDKCYDNSGLIHASRETDPMGGHDPYSSSKGAAELAVSSWRRSFFPSSLLDDHCCSLSSVRAGNVIGGGDWAEDRIIPDCIRALASDRPVSVRNPDAVRPWQHVLEPLSGYLTLAARQWADPVRFSDSFNFGPLPVGNMTVGRVADRVVKVWGEGRWEHTPADGQVVGRNLLHEASFLKLDITKATTLLGWSPVLTADESIVETISWYRDRHRARGGFDARAACLQQIASFHSRQTQIEPML
jgi:CDP-glucose 4,6-dehydratase